MDLKRAHINLLDSPLIPTSMEKLIDLVSHKKAWDNVVEKVATSYKLTLV